MTNSIQAVCDATVQTLEIAISLGTAISKHDWKPTLSRRNPKETQNDPINPEMTLSYHSFTLIYLFYSNLSSFNWT